MEVLIAISYFASAFTVSVVAVLLLRGPALRFGWVDYPDGNLKNHHVPIPMIGGIAVYLGIMVPKLLFMHDEFLPRSILISGALLVVVGTLDDRLNLNWRVRMLAQFAASLILIIIGEIRAEHLGPLFGLPDVEFGILSIPISVLGIVGLINALNMIDGIDGLLAVLMLISLVMFILSGLYAGELDVVLRSFITLGAVTGFLLFNLRYGPYVRARVFMGNAGSMLLGFTIAHIAFRLTQNQAHPISPIFSPYLVAVPVIDCLVLIARRLRNGRSPFMGDRNHVHHLLEDAGFTVNQTILLLAVVSVLLAAAAALWQLLDLPYEKSMMLLGFLLLLVVWYLFTLNRDRAVDRLAALHRWLAYRLNQA